MKCNLCGKSVTADDASVCGCCGKCFCSSCAADMQICDCYGEFNMYC